jgi:hypothetical protein
MLMLSATAAIAETTPTAIRIAFPGNQVVAVQPLDESHLSKDDLPLAKVTFGLMSFTVPLGISPDAGFALIPPVSNMVKRISVYLFLDSNEEQEEWRSFRENVFVMRSGQLSHVGVVTGTNDTPTGAGRSFVDGRFLDVDNQLEDNSFTSVAQAPVLWDAFLEKNSRFVYDPSQCWALNRRDYYDDLVHADQLEQRNLSENDQRYKLAPLLLALTVTDKYCSRSTKLIPNPIDQNLCAHSRRPMDIMVHGCSTSLFQE